MFEPLGYYREYYIGSKFIGKINCEKDRETVGYEGKRKEILQEDTIMTNNKKIKKGTEVWTLLYPFSGRLLK
jgi:hypothetical protein